MKINMKKIFITFLLAFCNSAFAGYSWVYDFQIVEAGFDHQPNMQAVVLPTTPVDWGSRCSGARASGEAIRIYFNSDGSSESRFLSVLLSAQSSDKKVALRLDTGRLSCSSYEGIRVYGIKVVND
ncbi:hypothetical protein M3P05_12455 [Sansalvadorimonas sp. 2012CJ34-2]|uniref:Uncharacterized protein n=1 Tax=Parendozoicomonas callyspongiae TaxID=2942213 RepID=A0ABT0PHL5_9GAMM|nr:hypothetical protein [Sansalvadorimonas sp. 2012CJ34-2]MCL6270736.1 hypothetical protein [Sansalvadorimonas sp. 2012CJ34-2]